MRQDLAIRQVVRDKIGVLARAMNDWEEVPRIGEDEAERIRQSIQPYQHSTSFRPFVIAGVDGTGDFPALSYGDSFVYVTHAQATRYQSEPIKGLKEVAPELDPYIEFTWLPEDDVRAKEAFDTSFENLVGCSVREAIERSDYRQLKAEMSGRQDTIDVLERQLFRPHATDSGNVAIQLRSTAELGAALNAICTEPTPDFVLLDSTLSLPFVTRRGRSLFFEHVKRLCCVEARARGTGFYALSKSHGLPTIEHVEAMAAETLGARPPEHWFMRIPTEKRDGWQLSLVENRNVPPPGAVSYLVRFHRNTPVMRLDMDVEYWKQNIQADTAERTADNEQKIFESLDYAGHDQRAYGYPYPIKAGHDRASLTHAERVALRKMIIDAAVEQGMRPQLFRSASQATGHG